MFKNPKLSESHRAHLGRRHKQALANVEKLMDARTARRVRRLKHWGALVHKLERRLFVYPMTEP